MSKSFSERPKALQLEGMDDDLRNSLWNVVALSLGDPSENDHWQRAAECVASEFRKVPIDNVQGSIGHGCRVWLRDYFYELPWNRVYDLIEYFVTALPLDQSGHRDHGGAHPGRRSCAVQLCALAGDVGLPIHPGALVPSPSPLRCKR
jgi:AbiJ N-terminal domain 4